MDRVRRWSVGVLALLLAGSPAWAADPVRHRVPRPGMRAVTVHAPRPRAATVALEVAPGLAIATPFTVAAGGAPSVVRVPHYIGPDGTYDEYADVVRSIEGTPCGEDCRRRALLRWGFAPVD